MPSRARFAATAALVSVVFATIAVTPCWGKEWPQLACVACHAAKTCATLSQCTNKNCCKPCARGFAPNVDGTCNLCAQNYAWQGGNCVRCPAAKPFSLGGTTLTAICFAAPKAPVGLVDNKISWTTTNDGNISAMPWTVSNGGLIIRFDVEKSANCGGDNDNVQSGTATATIVVGSSPVKFDFQLTGVGEAELSNFELMNLQFDGNLVGTAHAPGGNQGCTDGPTVFLKDGVWPMCLPAGSTHTFFLDFTTNDPLFHVKAFYQLMLTFAISPTPCGV